MGRHLNRGREARVDVDEVDVVDGDAGQLHRAAARDPDRRRAVELGAFTDGVGVVGVGARVRENPTVARNLEMLGLGNRGQDQHGRLVDHVVRVHQLGVGPADHAVGRRGLPDLLGGHLVAAPGMRVRCGDRGELRPQFTDAAPVRVGGLARGDAHGLLEHRIDVGRAVEVDADLGGTGHRHTLVGPGSHRHRLVLLGPVGFAPGRPELGSGSPGLGSGDQNRLRPARGDVEAGQVHQCLRDVAADAGVAGHRFVRPDALGQRQSRVPVAPRQQVDHAHRVDRLEHPRIGGGARSLLHQRDRLHVRAFGVLVHLAVSDKNRCPRIKGHDAVPFGWDQVNGAYRVRRPSTATATVSGRKRLTALPSATGWVPVPGEVGWRDDHNDCRQC